MRNHTLTHGRKAQLLIAVAILGLTGALSGLALAGQSTLSIPHVGSNATVPASKATPMADRMPSASNDTTSPSGTAAAAAPSADPIPAAILGANVPVPVPASIIAETNGWLVSDGSTLVAVYAGSRGDDPSQGRVVIVRQNLGAATQTVQTVDAGATGALTIAANAPSGAAVETSAQTGSLLLTTARGATLRLDLATNTITAK